MDNSAENDASSQLRGVKNPKVVDLIYESLASNEVILLIHEDRPWNSEPEQLDQLGEKFNNYLDYVLDGWFIKQYPQHAGKSVVFELTYSEHPPTEIQTRLSDLERFCQSVGIAFRTERRADIAEQARVVNA